MVDARPCVIATVARRCGRVWGNCSASEVQSRTRALNRYPQKSAAQLPAATQTASACQTHCLTSQHLRSSLLLESRAGLHLPERRAAATSAATRCGRCLVSGRSGMAWVALAILPDRMWLQGIQATQRSQSYLPDLGETRPYLKQYRISADMV